LTGNSQNSASPEKVYGISEIYRHAGDGASRFAAMNFNRCRILFAVFAVLCAASLRAVADEPFFFIQISDPQMGMFADNRDFVQDAANFEFVVATINRLKPAFVVVTGDLVNKGGDAAQIAEYRRISGKIDRAIPVYNIPGNHDVSNVPTPATIEGYTKVFGPDHYTFRHGGFVGITLNSTVIHSPNQASDQFNEQERWLRAELAKAKAEHARHIVIFQHHPWFIGRADEPDQYFNIPLARRTSYLAMFHEAGVRCLVSGHYHRNAEARDGEIEAITTGAVGKPLGPGAKSGLRVFIVRDDRIENHFYDLGDLPVKIELDPAAAKAKKKKQ
jgi:predicted phosphodiesterase